MSKTMKAFLDGLFAGCIAAGGTLSGALMEMPKGANIPDIGTVTWLVTAIFGLTAAFKGWKSYLNNPER